MITILQGQSKKFQFVLKDSTGAELDPDDFVRIKIFLYTQMLEDLVKWFYSPTEPTPTGYETATREDVSVPNNEIICILNKSKTEIFREGTIWIQINWVESDSEYEDSEKENVTKGEFAIVSKAKH